MLATLAAQALFAATGIAAVATITATIIPARHRIVAALFADRQTETAR